MRRVGEVGRSNDYTTFFFSNFPHGYGELDMIKVFQRSARVKEVFISRRLNRWGRRFGFVRFFEVRNVERLERELDNLYIGSMKLHVNVPKYRRHQPESAKEKRREKKATHLEEQSDPGKNKVQWVEKKRVRSYADAVNGETKEEKWKGPTFKSHSNTLPWMVNSVVGQFKEGLNVDQLREEFVKGGLNRIFIRYVGDRLVMLTPREGEKMEDIVKSNKEWFDSCFVVIKPWSASCMADHKIAWVRCYGLPLTLWNEECFAKILGDMATLVSVDTTTLLWEHLEFARLQIRLKNRNSIRVNRSLRINDQVWDVLLEEESPACYEGRRTDCWFSESSASASSSGTFVEETIFSNKSYEEEVDPMIRKAFRLEEVEGGGKAEEGGEGYANKTKLPFKVPSGNGSFGQDVVCMSSTKEGRLDKVACRGADLDVNPDLGRDFMCRSHLAYAELTKLVVDVERVSPRVEPLLRVGQVEAHCCMAQSHFVSPVGNVVVGLHKLREEARYVDANGNSNREISSGGKQVEGIGAAKSGESQGSGSRNPGLVNEPIHSGHRGRHEFDGGEGMPIPTERGEEGVFSDNRIMLSPRRNKIKGLFDLGDSPPLPRRSVRINARTNQAGASSHLLQGKSAEPISDGDFINCNFRLCETGNEVDSPKLWEVGKKVGLICRKDEVEVVKEYTCLEERDLEFLQRHEEGKNLAHL